MSQQTIDHKETSANAAAASETADNEFDQIDIPYLSPQEAVFTETAGHLLTLKTLGKEVSRIQVFRSFPHSNRSRFLSVRDADGKEIGMIRDLAEFDAETRALLEKFLDLRYFAPVITEIVSVKDEFGYTFWETKTTSGACRFVVRKDSKSVVKVADSQVLVVDVDGNRFVIEDLAALSDREMRLIELYI